MNPGTRATLVRGPSLRAVGSRGARPYGIGVWWFFLSIVPAIFTAASASDGPAGGVDRKLPKSPRGAVVILLDTVRADRLSCYGHSRATTPAVDALASKGVRFLQVVAPSPWTLPSVLTLLSADYPDELLTSWPKLTRSVVEQFAEAGISTAAVTEGGFVSKEFGMDRGFEHFFEQQGIYWAGSGFGRQKPAVELTFDRAIEWIEENRDQRFLLFIHTYEPHVPYTNRDFVETMEPGRIGPAFEVRFLQSLSSRLVTLTREEKNYVEALYDGDIRSADRQIARLLEFLETTGIVGSTLVVVTSDHGEELGEHSETNLYDHGHSLHDNQLLVPLVIHDPTRKFERRTVTEQVRLFDVLPTVAERLGVPMDRPTEGRSLVPLMEGREKADRLAFSAWTKNEPWFVAVRDGKHKLIRALTPRSPGADRKGGAEIGLFDLRADPGERNDLAQAEPGILRSMVALLDRWRQGMEGPPVPASPDVVDPEVLKRLRSLGYIH